MRVLAVDDDGLVLLSTSMILEELGYDVVQADSGPAALKHLESGTFDLVVSDVMMPGMNGLELLGEINARQPRLPVLLVSGFTNLPHGFQSEVALLSKPFSESQLAAAIKRLSAKSEFTTA